MSDPADVCLLLEGTYPYVPGGVSSWVHQLVSQLPELRFSLLFIGSQAAKTGPARYELPPNVVGMETFHLMDYRLPERPRRVPSRTRKQGYRAAEAFHQRLFETRATDGFLDAYERLFRDGTFNTRNLVSDREAWENVCTAYRERAPEESFIDYFWTQRFSHLPMWAVCQLVPRVPPARLYHSVSTGFAGLLGGLLKHEHGTPLLLTEHGIYTKERKIEITNAHWIYEAGLETGEMTFRELGYLKKLWIRCFEFLGRFAYEQADEIVTLYGGNKRLQLAHGAPEEKIRIVPNGIEVEPYAAVRDRRDPSRKRIGFVGRVVPIKDVKTFVRACKLVLDELPDVEILVLGPYDEDPDYFRECRELVRILGMRDRIRFEGKVPVLDYYPLLDVVVLTSISEGLPLVILEAHAAGVPVVATDVGACSELLHGRLPEDRALGRSGIVTGIASPEETARAVCTLLSESDTWAAMSRAGIGRVEAFYRQEDVLEEYRSLYRGLGV